MMSWHGGPCPQAVAAYLEPLPAAEELQLPREGGAAAKARL